MRAAPKRLKKVCILSQAAHRLGAYADFCNMKLSAVDRMLVPAIVGLPPVLNLPTLICTPGWREALRVSMMSTLFENCLRLVFSGI